MFRRRSKDEIKACRASPALPGSVADVADMSPVPVHVQSRPTSSATSRPPNSTFFHESSLPTLPIPSASSALRRYLETVKPIQTAAAHLQTIAIVTKFIETDTHTELHNKLTDYAATRPSFIEEFWTDAYLVPDTSPVLNLNPFFLLEDGPDQKTSKSQIGRASTLAFASLKFASLLKTQLLQPDIVRGTPLCMAQFRHIFGSARVPVLDAPDVVESCPGSTHIAVLCRGTFYYFSALHSNGDVAVDTEDLVLILEAIMSDATNVNADPSKICTKALGLMTTQQRNTWALTRANLVKDSPSNGTTLDIIDSALFVLVLDEFAPKDINEAAANCLHGTYNLTDSKPDSPGHQTGTCLNRWYDKLQLIVMSDGSAGVNFEHSAIDGHTALRFVSDIFADTVVQFAQSITSTIYAKNHVPSLLNAVVRRGEDFDFKPKRLDFEFPTSTLEDIHYAETLLGDQLLQSDTYVLEFKDYGKKFVTSNKMSPDSFVQMSIMLAYYKLYGEFVCSYEPVLMKRYKHGRTEAMRSATAKAKVFVETWCSNYRGKTEKVQALKDAIADHSKIVKEAAAGEGVDRYLFAIKCIAEKEGQSTEGLFDDSGWKSLNHTVLSTSNCGNPSLRLFGFGPVVPDGYGIGYIIRDGGLQYTITSKHRQTQRFANTLSSYLKEVHTLMSKGDKIEVRQFRHTSMTRVDTDGPIISPEMIASGSYMSEEAVEDAKRIAEQEAAKKKGVTPTVDLYAGYDDIYGESTAGPLMSQIKRKNSVDLTAGVGLDVPMSPSDSNNSRNIK